MFNRNVFGPVVLLLFLVSCGSWPPSPGTERDLLRLSKNERSLRVRRLPDDDLHALKRFTNLWRLDFGGGWGVHEAKISDKGIAILSDVDLSKLHSLCLSYNENITDRGLEILSGMALPELERLTIMHNPNITDEGIKHLSKIESLKWLSLRGCPNITDKGLKTLSYMPNLEVLDLKECNGITDVGLEFLTEIKVYR